MKKKRKRDRLSSQIEFQITSYGSKFLKTNVLIPNFGLVKN